MTAVPVVKAGTATMPALGLGTWELEGQDCTRAVASALDMGYRHVDTAQAYGNEQQVGAGLAAAAVAREEVWLTTKIWNSEHAPDDVVASVEQSLRRLGTDYVDLLLIHWPVAFDQVRATLAAMQDLVQDGKARHLGVSNFTPEQFVRARELAELITDQVEYHPFLDQSGVLDTVRDHGAALTAYSPLGRGKVLDEPRLSEIADGRGWTAAQVALRWLLDQDGVAAIPKSTSDQHLRANLEAAAGAPLSAGERAVVDGLPKDQRMIDPPFAPDWDQPGA